MCLTIQHSDNLWSTWLRYTYIYYVCVTQYHDRLHPFGPLHHHEVFHMQTLHRFEVRVNRGAEGKSAKVFVGQLSEENALELAGKVISESFLWLVSHLSAHLAGAVTAGVHSTS